MASTRNRRRAGTLQKHDEDLQNGLFAVLHVCCFSTSMKPEDTMSLLARLAASSKQLRGVVSAVRYWLPSDPGYGCTNLMLPENLARNSSTGSTAAQQEQHPLQHFLTASCCSSALLSC
jgi:hypothetical protein